MQTLHSSLVEQIKWYANWHTLKGIILAHWLFFFAFTFTVSNALLTSVSDTEVIESKLIAGPAYAVTRPPAGIEGTRIMVKFKKDTSPNERSEIAKQNILNEKKYIKQIGIASYEISEDDTVEEVMARLSSKHGNKIEYVAPDPILKPSYLPNDPYINSEWHISNIHAPVAWNSATGSSITIAILDGGVNCNHPELSASCVPGWNTVSNNTDTAPVNTHGTAVAATASAIGDNGYQVAGVSYRSKIMPIRITNTADGNAYGTDLSEGIVWAADHGARIVNASYRGWNTPSATDASIYLQSKGGMFFTASGNETIRISQANDPAYSVVSATDESNRSTTWTNYGPVVDFSAPGINILTVCDDLSACPSGLGSAMGTSFSTPITAAVAALVMTARPDLTPSQIENILKTSAIDLGAPGWDEYFGWGKIDAGNAVTQALTVPTSTNDTTPPSAPSNLTVQSVTASGVSLVWVESLDNVGVVGYEIYRNNIKIGTSNLTTFTDNTTVPNTNYSYFVRAYDGAGNMSQQSGNVSIVTPEAIFAITSTSVSQKTGTTATINWVANALATATVKYGLTSNLSLSSSSPIKGTSGTIQLNGLKPKTKYFYQVIAVKDSNGNSTASPVSTFRTASR